MKFNLYSFVFFVALILAQTSAKKHRGNRYRDKSCVKECTSKQPPKKCLRRCNAKKEKRRFKKQCREKCHRSKRRRCKKECENSLPKHSSSTESFDSPKGGQFTPKGEGSLAPLGNNNVDRTDNSGYQPVTLEKAITAYINNYGGSCVYEERPSVFKCTTDSGTHPMWIFYWYVTPNNIVAGLTFDFGFITAGNFTVYMDRDGIPSTTDCSPLVRLCQPSYSDVLIEVQPIRSNFTQCEAILTLPSTHEEELPVPSSDKNFGQTNQPIAEATKSNTFEYQPITLEKAKAAYKNSYGGCCTYNPVSRMYFCETGFGLYPMQIDTFGVEEPNPDIVGGLYFGHNYANVTYDAMRDCTYDDVKGDKHNYDVMGDCNIYTNKEGIPNWASCGVVCQPSELNVLVAVQKIEYGAPCLPLLTLPE